jgi:hypothetical protein
VSIGKCSCKTFLGFENCNLRLTQKRGSVRFFPSNLIEVKETKNKFIPFFSLKLHNFFSFQKNISKKYVFLNDPHPLVPSDMLSRTIRSLGFPVQPENKYFQCLLFP